MSRRTRARDEVTEHFLQGVRDSLRHADEAILSAEKLIKSARVQTLIGRGRRAKLVTTKPR